MIFLAITGLKLSSHKQNIIWYCSWKPIFSRSRDRTRLNEKNYISIFSSQMLKTGSIRDDRYRISMENSLKLIELSSIKLVYIIEKSRILPNLVIPSVSTKVARYSSILNIIWKHSTTLSRNLFFCKKSYYTSCKTSSTTGGVSLSTIVQQMVVNLQLSEWENNVHSFHYM